MRSRLIKTLKEKAYEIIVVLICVAISCFFVSLKEGFHMDELLSFELANAEFNPWIVTTQPEGRLAKFVHSEIDGETFGETVDNLAAVVKDVLQNRGGSKLLNYTADVYEEPVWITKDQFFDYITVGDGDAFNYLSVYFNVKDDNHPPLHFMLLHTVSSVFRGKVSPWVGCVINLAAVVWVLLLLYRICDILACELGLNGAGRKIGLMTALFYGLSTGAVATVLLIRMYGMLTLWCVLYFYLILKKWRSASFDRENACLILVTLLGFWTQYFFLFYCLLLAVTVIVCLGKSKRRKELFCFVRSMAASALAGLTVFPFAISDVFSSERGVEALGNLSQGLGGYGLRLLAFWRILLDRETGTYSLTLVVLLAAFVLAGLRRGKKSERHERMESAERDEGSDRTEKGDPAKEQGRRDLLWMLLLPPAGYFLLAARMSPYLVDRYIMPLFPFAALILMLAVFGLLEKMKKMYAGEHRRHLTGTVCIILISFQVWNLTGYDGSYLYKGYSEQLKTAEEYRGYSCICVYDGVGYYENLREFTYYEKSLLVTLEELEDRKEQDSINELGQIVVLVKPNVDELRVLEILTENYGFDLEREVWFEPDAHGDEIFILGKDA